VLRKFNEQFFANLSEEQDQDEQDKARWKGLSRLPEQISAS